MNNQAYIDAKIKELFGPKFSIQMKPCYDNFGVSIMVMGPGIPTSYQPNPPNSWYVSFGVHETPACCGSFFLYGFSSSQPGQGYGKKGLELVKFIAQKGGFSFVIGVVPNKDNNPATYPSWAKMERMLSNAGWTHSKDFDVLNKRSGNNLCWWALKVNGY